MVVKPTLSEKIFTVFNYVFLAFLSAICIYPLLYVLFASVSEPTRLMAHEGVMLAPLGFTLKGYQMVFKNPNILTGYANTIFYVVSGTVISIVMTSLGAYVLSRKGVLFSKLFMMMITVTMFFNGGLIPFYLLIKNLGWLDTWMAIVIPGAISSWNLIVMRTSFMGIPASLEESARIDGANDFVILFRIIMPLSKAVIAVMVLFYGVGMWNSWFNASIFLTKREMFPLQLILREILIKGEKNTILQMSQGATPTESSLYTSLIQYATIIVATLPILCAYPFLQKYFVKGVMVGSLKG